MVDALHWLEAQPPPIVLAPRGWTTAPYCLSVPNNAMDVVAKAWSRGNYFGSRDASPAKHRTMKTVRATRMVDGDTVHYVWPLTQGSTSQGDASDTLELAAKRLVALGWGIDLVVGNTQILDQDAFSALGGERWQPTEAGAVTVLRTPKPGTFDALTERYASFLARIGKEGFVPAEPLRHFSLTGYRRSSDPVGRPHAVFELRHDDGSFCAYSHRRLIHIAGMLRHLAKKAMAASPPAGVDGNWVERYVLGHRDENAREHRQFSYVPLPSIGHRHADHLVRRIMMIAPVGDEELLEHLALRLSGRQLQPLPNTDFGPKGPPSLVRARHGKMASHYTDPANVWHSVTPVILPGHDDHKPAKRRGLIERALAQSGIDQPCEFEPSALSRFPKAFSAHKYDRQGKPQGYIRPDHLLSQTAVHLTVRFKNELRVIGPITIGAGRHFGLGLFAAQEV
jgi:CRISPR-associated protein Csb2